MTIYYFCLRRDCMWCISFNSSLDSVMERLHVQNITYWYPILTVFRSCKQGSTRSTRYYQTVPDFQHILQDQQFISKTWCPNYRCDHRVNLPYKTHTNSTEQTLNVQFHFDPSPQFTRYAAVPLSGGRKFLKVYIFGNSLCPGIITFHTHTPEEKTRSKLPCLDLVGKGFHWR